MSVSLALLPFSDVFCSYWFLSGLRTTAGPRFDVNFIQCLNLILYYRSKMVHPCERFDPGHISRTRPKKQPQALGITVLCLVYSVLVLLVRPFPYASANFLEAFQYAERRRVLSGSSRSSPIRCSM